MPWSAAVAQADFSADLGDMPVLCRAGHVTIIKINAVVGSLTLIESSSQPAAVTMPSIEAWAFRHSKLRCSPPEFL